MKTNVILTSAVGAIIGMSGLASGAAAAPWLPSSRM